MIYRLLTALTLTTTTTVGTITTGGDVPKAVTQSTVVKDTTETVRKQQLPDVHEVMLHKQLQTRKAGSVRFWEAVSWCETNHKWDDGGYYAGGLGIAQSAWRGFGGWEFGTSPRKATKTQQIIVANRIAFLGFQTKRVFATLEDRQNNKPFFRPAIGWRSASNWGKNCVNWRTRKPLRDKYTQTD